MFFKTKHDHFFTLKCFLYLNLTGPQAQRGPTHLWITEMHVNSKKCEKQEKSPLVLQREVGLKGCK